MMYNPANGELTHTATPGTLAADLDQTTVAIGATTATAINIGNAGSTTTINGTLSVPALVSGNITADDSMSITTASGDGNEISIVPQGTNRAVNLTADVIRISGDVILPIVAKAGVVGDIKGSVVGDDSTVLIDGVAGKIVGDIASTNIHGTAFKADTIVNNNSTTLDITAAGFLNIFGGADDAGVSNIQMDKNGINHIELKTEPGNPGNPTDYARVAINAGTNEGDVRIGTPVSTRNQVVEMYNATVYGTLVGEVLGTIVGDVQGSVVADDSSVIIDGVAGKVVGPISKIVGDVQQISGAGAISLDTLVTEITTTGADAYTLADGVVGQIKIIAMIVDGGDATLTPTTLATGTTITFSDVNDNITLLYTTNGWLNTANQNATIA
jgi:outer membrane lipoprotein SlyB